MMKSKFWIFVVLIFVPMSAWSQSTLNFPAAIHPGQLGSYGYAVVNPNSSAAAVTFKLYNHSDGLEIGSATLTIPAQGQVSKLASELFGNPAINPACWVQATSATSGLQGFYIVGDFATRVDGAEAATAATDLIVPLAGNTTALSIANPGSSAVSVNVRLFAANGAEISPAISRTVQAHGGFHTDIMNLSANEGTVYAQAKYIRVSGTGPVAGVADISNFLVFGKDSAVVNGVSTALLAGQLNFPHVVSGQLGGANYTTTIAITNLAPSSQTVTLTFARASGTPVTVQRTIAANGTLVESAQTVFGLPTDFQNGWVQIVGTATSLVGLVAYADTNAGGLAIVPGGSGSTTNLLFAHIADLDPWWTGLALLNATSSDAQIEIFAMNPSGSLIGGADNVATARFTLPAGSKTAQLLGQFIPQTQTRTADGGFVYVRSTNAVPILGLELFFLRSGAALANVSAGSVPSGVTFTPPR